MFRFQTASKQWLAWVAGWLAVAATAHAHAPPEVHQLILGQSTVAPLLVANRGLIFGATDEGDVGQPTHWELMCNDALGISTSQTPSIAALPDGRLLAATALGLWQSSDRACSWQQLSGFDAALSASALVQTTHDPERLWVAAVGGSGDHGGLYRSSDGGRSWLRQLPTDALSQLSDVLLSEHEPIRLYATKLSTASGELRHSLLRSDDLGESWSELPLVAPSSSPMMPGTTSRYALLSVSPSDPDLLLVAARADMPARQRDQLWVSRDGGQSFSSPQALYVISGAAFDPAGEHVWVASEEGLYASSDGAETFGRIGDADVLSCVSQHEGRLYVCGFFAGISAGQEGVGVSDDGGETFAPFMQLHDVSAPLTCDPGAETSQRCIQPWMDWAREQLPAAGDAKATTMDAATASATERSNSGCSVVEAGAARTFPGWSCLLYSLGCMALGARHQRGSSSVRRRRKSRIAASTSATPDA